MCFSCSLVHRRRKKKSKRAPRVHFVVRFVVESPCAQTVRRETRKGRNAKQISAVARNRPSSTSRAARFRPEKISPRSSGVNAASSPRLGLFQARKAAPHGPALLEWCVFTSRFDASPSFSLAVAAAARATIASARVSGVSDLAREGNLCARARGRWGFARASRRRRRRATPRASRRDAAPRVATPRRRRIHDSTPSPSRARRPRRPQRAGFLGFRPFLFPRARGRLDGNPPSRAPQVRRRGVDIASASR